MALSSELTTEIRVAFMELSQHPQGELPLFYRRQIRRSLGPFLQNAEGLPDGPGYRRRVRLSILCVLHVMPVWDAVFPDDDRPQRMLEVCERLMMGQISRQEARQENQRFWLELDTVLPEEPAASYVGYAAISAVGVACNDDDPTASLEEDDYDTDPYGWDDSFYSALAFAGGEVGAEGASDQRRRDFWRWYLEEAVAQAYDSVPD